MNLSKYKNNSGKNKFIVKQDYFHSKWIAKLF